MEYTRTTASKYVFGDRHRTFLNPALHCSSACSYCYLPKIGLSITTKPERVDVDRICNDLLLHPGFTLGLKGTIISIGCYTECWDPSVRPITIQLIKRLLPLGNPIQFATKRCVTEEHFDQIVGPQEWAGQLTIFISCATISFWKLYEAGTPPPAKRFLSFVAAKKYNVPTYLYIKPVLPGITIQDAQKFLGIILRYKVDAVVGELFSTQKSLELAPIGEQYLYLARSDDAAKLKQIFAPECNVYDHSVEAVEFWRSQCPASSI